MKNGKIIFINIDSKFICWEQVFNFSKQGCGKYDYRTHTVKKTVYKERLTLLCTSMVQNILYITEEVCAILWCTNTLNFLARQE